MLHYTTYELIKWTINRRHSHGQMPQLRRRDFIVTLFVLTGNMRTGTPAAYQGKTQEEVMAAQM